jgi:hypothetical protein
VLRAFHIRIGLINSKKKKYSMLIRLIIDSPNAKAVPSQPLFMGNPETLFLTMAKFIEREIRKSVMTI